MLQKIERCYLDLNTLIFKIYIYCDNENLMYIILRYQINNEIPACFKQLLSTIKLLNTSVAIQLRDIILMELLLLEGLKLQIRIEKRKEKKQWYFFESESTIPSRYVIIRCILCFAFVSSPPQQWSTRNQSLYRNFLLKLQVTHLLAGYWSSPVIGFGGPFRMCNVF